MEIDWNQVRRRWLWRHFLLEIAPAGRLLEVVSQTCGIHAQLMPAAEMSIGVRPAVTRDDVRTALWKDRRLDGAVGGVWARRQRGRRLEVRVGPFRRLNARLRGELEDQVARVGAMVEAKPELIIGPVEVRAHL